MDFKKEFLTLAEKLNPGWDIKGFISGEELVYSLGSDTKVLSTIFELLCRPIVQKIAKKHGYKVEEAPQTVYPDFTLLKDKDDKEKIAIDVKTTYRKFRVNGSLSPFVFTLGSYTSFIRNGTKNILYPFSDYSKHWIIGFLYTRNLSETDEGIYSLKDIKSINTPYKDVDYFVQEKHKIAGKRTGSGNTAKIGSMATSDIKDLDNGKGPFAAQGEEAFLKFWREYNK